MEQEHRPEDFGIGRLFQHVRDAVVVANAKTERILLWNQGAAEIFGYTRDQALTMKLHQLVAPHLVDRHRAGLARYQETGHGAIVDAGKPAEVEAVNHNGTVFPVELTLTAIESEPVEDGRIVLAIVRDASDRKAANQVREARVRQQAALEIHDSIVQGIVVAKTSFELGEFDRGMEILTKTLQMARAMVGQYMEDRESIFGLNPGDFVRTDSASLDPLNRDET